MNLVINVSFVKLESDKYCGFSVVRTFFSQDHCYHVKFIKRATGLKSPETSDQKLSASVRLSCCQELYW